MPDVSFGPQFPISGGNGINIDLTQGAARSEPTYDYVERGVVERLTAERDAAVARAEAAEAAIREMRDDEDGHFCWNATPCAAAVIWAKPGTPCSPWCQKRNDILARAALAAAAPGDSKEETER